MANSSGAFKRMAQRSQSSQKPFTYDTKYSRRFWMYKPKAGDEPTRALIRCLVSPDDVERTIEVPVHKHWFQEKGAFFGPYKMVVIPCRKWVFPDEEEPYCPYCEGELGEELIDTTPFYGCPIFTRNEDKSKATAGWLNYMFESFYNSYYEALSLAAEEDGEVTLRDYTLKWTWSESKKQAVLSVHAKSEGAFEIEVPIMTPDEMREKIIAEMCQEYFQHPESDEEEAERNAAALERLNGRPNRVKAPVVEDPEEDYEDEEEDEDDVPEPVPTQLKSSGRTTASRASTPPTPAATQRTGATLKAGEANMFRNKAGAARR